jgi:hypothetical protein
MRPVAKTTLCFLLDRENRGLVTSNGQAASADTIHREKRNLTRIQDHEKESGPAMGLFFHARPRTRMDAAGPSVVTKTIARPKWIEIRNVALALTIDAMGGGRFEVICGS